MTFKKETIAEAYFESCKKYSNRIALIDYCRNISYTYSDLEKSIKGIASSLTKKGVCPGTITGIIATNCPEYLMLETALSSMGCTVMLCNPNFTKREILNWIFYSKPTMLFITEDVMEKASQVAAEVSFVKDLYLIGNRKRNYHSVEDLMNDSGNMNPIGHLKLDVDKQIALVIYTSGTTGTPKGIMHCHTSLVYNFHQLNHGRNVVDNANMILSLPMYHIYGSLVIPAMSIYSGATTVILPKFDPINFLTSIEKYKVNILHLTPSQVRFLLNHPQVSNYNLSSVRKCISGGSILDGLTKKRFLDKFRIPNSDFEINEMYGSTECLTIIHSIPNSEALTGKERSIGLLSVNTQCKVVDVSSREEVSANCLGELLIKGPTIMKGYLGKSLETQNVFENGWVKTGDIGYHDKDNYFYITDRIVDIIRVNDYRISPTELEETMLSIPGIADCAVIGVPDEKCGEIPKAFVVRNNEITEKEINEYMNNNLSSHKQLKGGIHFINEIPRSPAGKILRQLLKTK